MLVSPEDRSSHDRMPIEHRPTLEWRRPSNGGPFFYLIESQEGEPGTVRPVRWQNNQFSLVSEEFPDIGRGPAVIRTQAPFGSGHRPYRWRIWAIDRGGYVAQSDWRTIFYRN